MGPVKRVTPDVGFPESQRGSLTYGQPWPLSEDYYLCVYEPVEVKSLRPSRNYGVYLVDSFGNKELIYRDPEIACQSPIPLRPRRRPTAMPKAVVHKPSEKPFVAPTPPGHPEPEEGTVAVMDVYNSQKPWPAGTKIKALRVIQILPMTVPSGGPPHEIGLRLPSARDSVIARSPPWVRVTVRGPMVPSLHVVLTRVIRGRSG